MNKDIVIGSHGDDVRPLSNTESLRIPLLPPGCDCMVMAGQWVLAPGWGRGYLVNHMTRQPGVGWGEYGKEVDRGKHTVIGVVRGKHTVTWVSRWSVSS